MRHLSDGVLRRLCDEPFAVSDAERQHATTCPRCRHIFEEIAQQARETARLMAVPEARFDTSTALAMVHRRMAADGARRRGGSRAARTLPWPSWIGRLAAMLRLHAGARRIPVLRPAAGAMAALALISALALTPAGSLAESFITIFQPTQIAAVPVTSADLRTLPDLRQYGTMHGRLKSVRSQEVTDAGAAAVLAHMQVLIPASLPAGVPSAATYEVIPGTTSWFTFSAARARKAAARAGKPVPAMPSRIDGSTLQLKTGAAVVAVYGPKQGIPSLVVGQMAAPSVSSTGVSVKQLEAYVLSLPGVSPQLASAIRSVGDPTTTLPLPIPIDMAHADKVQVQGVQGLAVGDSTGVGSAVVWEKGGLIYGVAGPLKESDVLGVADSLH